MVIDDFASKKIPLQGTQDDWSEYASHWDTMYKVTTVDALGVPQSVWETSNGMDHFAHATLYWRVGMDKFKNDGGKIFDGERTMFPSAPTILMDDTLPFKAQPIYEQVQEDDWRNV